MAGFNPDNLILNYFSDNRFHINNKIREFLRPQSEEREEPLPKKRVSVPPKKFTEDDSDDTDIECAPVRVYIALTLYL